MKFQYDEKSKSYSCIEYQGVCGYTILPYKDKYSLYFTNAWRSDIPLGEFISHNAKCEGMYAEPSGGFSEEFLFSSPEDAKMVAQEHKDRYGYEGYDNDDEENDENDDRLARE